MTGKQKKEWGWRLFLYVIGSVILAFGIVLNTKTDLGVSPIISIPFTITAIWGWNFGLMTFCSYVVFVILQLLLRGKKRQWHDLLQIPVSALFSYMVNFFNCGLDFHFNFIWEQILLLIAAVAITGLGVFLMVNMRLIPNPADGLAQAIGDLLGKNLGFGKNFLDCFSVAFSLTVGFFATGGMVTIGLGTVIAMVGVGRFVALYNALFRTKLEGLAGVCLEPYRKTGEESC